jgi:1-aminocyclopropane-1-carboxylate deaminase
MRFSNSDLYRRIKSSPLQVITHPLLTKQGITLSIKRDDLLDPNISGNKWRKLKHNLLYAEANDINHIISFGGAFSNHIHALAAASHYFNFKATGIIRGEPQYASNPTLSDAQQWGMKLEFVDRKTYRLKEQQDYLLSLQSQFPDAYIIPEGGSNHLATRGVEEIVREIAEASIIQSTGPADHIFTATGSAGTLAGLVSGALQYSQNTTIHGVAVLKDGQYLENTVNAFVNGADQVNWHLHTEFHEGGYGKISPTLNRFCHEFIKQTNIPIEPIYTGKMFFALWQLIKQGYFEKGSHIVAIHTGGLQGLAGLRAQQKY